MSVFGIGPENLNESDVDSAGLGPSPEGDDSFSFPPNPELEASSSLLDSGDIQRLKEKGYANPAFFLRNFLPDWFPGPIPWVHRGIAAIVLRRADFLLEFDADYGQREFEKILSNFFWKDSMGEKHYIFHWDSAEPDEIIMVLGQNVLVMMPRGFSKTTLMMGLITFSVCYREIDFELLVSASQGHSNKSVTAIANALETNPLIRRAFGAMRPPQRAGIKWSESEGEITTLSGVSLLARGSGSQIRGSNINAKRPKRILADDLEDRETVNTPEQRQKLKQWFFSDLKYALPRTYKEGSIVVLGTLLHREALTTVMWDDPDFVSVVFGAIDAEGDALWPQAMTLDEIEADKVSMASKGLVHVHYMELHNRIVAPEDQAFKEDQFLVFPRSPDDFVLKAIAMDPAISDRKEADFASIAMGGITKDGFFHIYDIWMDKGKEPDKLLEQFFKMLLSFGMTSQDKFGIESIAYQKALLTYLRQLMFKKKFFFECQAITHGNQNKDARILGHLHGRYASKSVTHQGPFPQYKGQLLDFPNGKKDGPDSVSMMFSLLGPAMPVAGSGGDVGLGKDEYGPIEDMVGGNWRRY